MIEAVADKIREGIAVWMNETAFDTLRDDFIAKLDNEFVKYQLKERETMNLIEQDYTAINTMIKKCNDLTNQMNRF